MEKICLLFRSVTLRVVPLRFSSTLNLAGTSAKCVHALFSSFYKAKAYILRVRILHFHTFPSVDNLFRCTTKDNSDILWNYLSEYGISCFHENENRAITARGDNTKAL